MIRVVMFRIGRKNLFRYSEDDIRLKSKWRFFIEHLKTLFCQPKDKNVVEKF